MGFWSCELNCAFDCVAIGFGVKMSLIIMINCAIRCVRRDFKTCSRRHPLHLYYSGTD